MKLLLAIPSYGPIDPIAARYVRAAIMHAASHGVTWVGDLSPDRMKFDAARNTVVKGALELAGEADGVLWLDSDVLVPVDGISRLAASGKDFITGVYCQRYAPHYPLIAHFDRERESFNWCIGMPPDVVAPIDGCGFGCVLTSTKMLRALGDGPWFTFERYSEDFDFCLKAQRAGFQLFVDTGILCGHLADPRPVTYADFLAVRDTPAIGIPERSSAA